MLYSGSTIIRPILHYGCHIWHNKAKIKSIQNELQHVRSENGSLRHYTGTASSSLNTVLNTESNVEDKDKKGGINPQFQIVKYFFDSYDGNAFVFR